MGRVFHLLWIFIYRAWLSSLACYSSCRKWMPNPLCSTQCLLLRLAVWGRYASHGPLDYHWLTSSQPTGLCLSAASVWVLIAGLVCQADCKKKKKQTKSFLQLGFFRNDLITINHLRLDDFKVTRSFLPKSHQLLLLSNSITANMFNVSYAQFTPYQCYL